MHVMKLWLLFILLAITLIGCDSATPTPLPPTITLVPTNTLQPTATHTPFPTSTPVRVAQTIAQNPSEQANVRIVNAGMYLPPIDVDIQGLSFAFGLEFGITTLPSGIVAGDYELTVTNENNILLQQTVQIGARSNLILMFTGTSDAVNLSIYAEDISPLNAGQSRINLIHAVNRGPNITLQEGNADLTTPIEFGQSSNALVVDSRPFTFFLQSGLETLYTLPTTLEERKSYTYILAGDFNEPDTITLINFSSRVPALSQIRFINAMFEVGTIDVYFNNVQIASNVEVTRITERQGIGSESYELALYPAGSDPSATEPITQLQLSIRGDRVTLVLVGSTSDNIQIVAINDDITLTASDESRIQFVNTSPNVPNVSVLMQGGEPIEGISTITYAQSSSIAELQSGTYGFFWSRMNNGVVGERVEAAENIILEPGRSYLYLFTGQDIPLIFSDNVGIDPTVTLADLDETIGETPQPTGPTRIRFIHAIDSAPLINVFLGDLQIGSLLPFRQTIDYTIIPSGLHIVSVREETNTQILGAVEFDFQPNTDYSVFAYGFEAAGFQVDVFEDNIVPPTEDFSSIRLVNLGHQDNTEFGLRYIVSSGPAPQPEIDLTEEVTTSRPSLFAGTRVITEAVDYRQATGFGIVDPGQIDIIIVDRIDRIAHIYYNVTIEPRTVYEVIVYEDLYTSEIRGFILEIPQP